MTADQYYFPYLFNIETFNAALAAFELSSYITYDEKTQMPEELLITAITAKTTLLTISFGTTLMIDGNNFFYWQTDTNLADITQVSLDSLASDAWILNSKLDLSALNTGKTAYKSHFDIERLVTYARKDSIKYNQPVYEKYVIVILEKEQVNVIPFDWFNKPHSEYDYTWPATAKLDTATGTLYGKGIRMPDFCIALD